MILRSSSTPVLGSLISSITDSPSNHKQLLLCHSNNHHQYHHNLMTTIVHCNSSPSIEFHSDHHQNYSVRRGSGLMRRAQSDGNLEGLAFASWNSTNNEDYSFTNKNINKNKKKVDNAKCLSMLETIPSFSFYNSRRLFEDDEDEDDDEELVAEQDEPEQGYLEVKVSKDGQCRNEHMVLSEEVPFMERIWNNGYGEKEDDDQFVRGQMHQATELDIGGDGGGRRRGGGGRGSEQNSASGGEEGEYGTEEYYKKMVQENPGNPLFLRNYAQFLYQKKQDMVGAEEYYSRAVLADPGDGEILSQYAKLLWELHHDEDRSSSYFERSVQASPQDSHVQAAYASFLWETEEGEDECNVPNDHFDHHLASHLHNHHGGFVMSSFTNDV